MIAHVKPESLEFAPDAPDEVLERMAALVDRQRGWINLEPVVDDETPVPLCTWAPSSRRRRGRVTPQVLGVQHHVRQKVADVVPVPAGWLVVQDHATRGLVVHAPVDEASERTLRWLLDAGAALCPVTADRWAAHVFSVVG